MDAIDIINQDLWVQAIIDGSYCRKDNIINPKKGCINLNGANLRELSAVNTVKLQQIPRIHLFYASLVKTILPINLARADLTGADLTGADLTGADLTGAYLIKADLTRADLTGADLTRANLIYANLAHAHLDGADLTGANLTKTYLSTNLSGAILNNVKNIHTAIMSQYTVFNKVQMQNLVALGVNIDNIQPNYNIKSARPPILKRTLSFNIPDQFHTNFCWAYAISKVIHKYLKSILPEELDQKYTTNERTQYCDIFFNNILFLKFKDKITPSFCGSLTLYNNIVLFNFIFGKLTNMRGCDAGAPFFLVYKYIKAFFKNFIKPDLKVEDLLWDGPTALNLIHDGVVFILLQKIGRIRNTYKVNMYGRNIMSPHHFTYDLLFLIVKKIIDQNLYVFLGVDLTKVSHVLFKDMQSSLQHASHAMTIVGYDVDEKSFKIKNSWGDAWGEAGYITLQLDQLPRGEDDNIFIIWIENPNDVLYFKSSKGLSEQASRGSSANHSDEMNKKYSDNYDKDNSDYLLDDFVIRKKGKEFPPRNQSGQPSPITKKSIWSFPFFAKGVKKRKMKTKKNKKRKTRIKL